MPDVRFPPFLSGPKMPDGQGGEVDNPFWEMIDNANGFGYDMVDEGGWTWLKGLTDINRFSVEKLAQFYATPELRALGIEVYEYPLYFEVDSTLIDPMSEIPNEFERPQVLVDPGDPEADPPVEPTFRNQYWSECHGFREDAENNKFWVSTGLGPRYMLASVAFTIAETPGITVVNASALPQNPVEL